MRQADFKRGLGRPERAGSTGDCGAEGYLGLVERTGIEPVTPACKAASAANANKGPERWRKGVRRKMRPNWGRTIILSATLPCGDSPGVVAGAKRYNTPDLKQSRLPHDDRPERIAVECEHPARESTYAKTRPTVPMLNQLRRYYCFTSIGATLMAQALSLNVPKLEAQTCAVPDEVSRDEILQR